MIRKRPQQTFLLLLALGAFLTTAILTGDLLVGTSVRKSLQDYHSDKWGDIRFVLSASRIPSSLGQRASEALDCPAEAVLTTTGRISSGMEQQRGVLVYGIEETFFRFYPEMELQRPLPAEHVRINRTLADQLELTKGDILLLHVQPLRHALQSPLELTDTEEITLRLTVSAIMENTGPGRLSEEISQQSRSILYLNRGELERATGIPANRLFIGGRDSALSPEEISDRLQSVFLPEDASFVCQGTKDGIRISSMNTFINDEDTEKITGAFPGTTSVRSSFVPEAIIGDRAVRFLFVTSGDSLSGVVLEENLAAELQWLPGENLELSHFRFSEDTGLLTRESVFLPVQESMGTEQLRLSTDNLPAFPGLDESEDCADWSTLLPLDLESVSEKEEAAWDTYGRMPRILLPEGMARNLGMPAVSLTVPASREGFTAWLRTKTSPEDWGYRLRPVYRIHREAAAHSMDFTSLFLSLSFFILMATALLSGGLSRLFLSRRTSEKELLQDLGFSPGRIVLFRLKEVSPFVLGGAVAGIAGGLLYLKLILIALETIWVTTTGTQSLSMHIDGSQVLTSLLAGSGLTLGLFLFLCRLDAGKKKQQTCKKRRAFLFLVPTVVFLVLPLLLPFWVSRQQLPLISGGSIFLGGFFLLSALPEKNRRLNRNGILGLFLLRERKNRLTLVALLALSLFLNVAVTGQKMTITGNPEKRPGPTGGFQWIVQTGQPVHPVLSPLEAGESVGLRISGTDRADCLNINAITHPALAGVPVREMEKRNSFSMIRTEPGPVDWSLLDRSPEDDVLPAFVDDGVLLWLLNKEVGDELVYPGKNGQPVRIRIVGTLNNTILQGYLILSEENLKKHFPDTGGYSLLLVEHGVGDRAELQRRFRLYGGKVTGTTESLQGYLELQNTYLQIFRLLSALSLLIAGGSFFLILKIDITRHQREMALLKDLGYPRTKILGMFCIRYLAILALAIALAFLGTTAFGLIMDGRTAHLYLLLLKLSAMLILPAAVSVLLPFLKAEKGPVTNLKACCPFMQPGKK